MQKIWLLYSQIIEYFQKNKVKSYTFLWLLGIIILTFIFTFIFNRGFSPSFQVSGANFDLWIKKIPYNVNTIDIHFSKDILESSISKDIFTITPNIPGVLKHTSPNTLTYELSEKLTIWQDYTIQISKNLLSDKKDHLDEDILYIISAVAGAKVTKVIPDEKLENISKNMAVFFSIPQIPLSTLEDKSKIICPITITPKVDGKCSWTTSSVVEFIPRISFAGATKYDYTISNSSGMLYPLEWTLSGSFSTPNLEVTLPETFLPQKNISLNFNYPVSVNELQKNLTLSSPDFQNKEKSNWIEKDVIIEPVWLSENQFTVQLKSWDFFYDTDYKIDIKKWLMPKYGNIPLEKDVSQIIHSDSLVSEIYNYQDVYSSTGALLDTKNVFISYNDYSFKNLPIKDIFFHIVFNEDIALDKNLFSFQKKDSSQKIDFTLSYVKEENEQKQTVENKKIIRLSLSSPLDISSQYSLIIAKASNKNLLQDIEFSYKTAPELKVENYVFIDYSKSCVYLNNRLDDIVNKTPFSFSNSWTIKEISLWEYIYDWNFEQSLENLSQWEKNKKLSQAWYCPEAEKWQYLYAIQTRLNPETTYKFSIEKLQDLYGNTLKNTFEKEITTGKLQEKDKYIYTQLNNFTNVFPTNVPMVLNLQTINTDTVYADICEMNYDDYVTFLKSPYGDFSSCLKKTTKTLSVKNNFWNLTNNKFDLEQDILWNKTNAYFIWVEIYATPNKSKEGNYSKNLIVRTNMWLFLEKASNKSLLFATDLEKHTEIKGINLEFYDYDFKKATVKYSFDEKKKVYVIDSDLSGISYIIAKKDNYYWIVAWEDFFSNYDFKYISGQDSSDKHYAYVYTDRPIYRPGDEVFIKWLLRDFTFEWFKKSSYSSGTLTLIDEQWNTYRSIDITIDKNSNFSGSFIIPKDTLLWNFRFEFRPKTWNDFVYTNGFFSIEEYRKPSFKVDIESGKNDISLWEKTQFTITPKYYFGWKLLNTSGKYSILSQNYFFDGKEYADYQFWNGNDYFECIYWGYCNYGDNLFSGINEFRIGENWQYSFPYDFWNDVKNSEKIYTFNVEVEDPDTKKVVSNSVSKVLHTTDAYVWLKANYYNDIKSGIDFEIMSLDFDAKPLPYKNIKVELIKKDYKQVKKLWVDGVFYNEYAEEKVVEKTFSLITNEKWYVKHSLSAKNSWEYEIKVSYTGKNNQTFSSSQVVYVAGNDYISWRNDNNSVTELEAEKITYALWETAIFTLKSPVNNGKALFVIEKDDGILDYFIHDIQSYGDKIELKLEENHYPNVYLKAFLIGTQKDNPLPVYKRALWVVKVVTDYKKLNVSLVTDKKSYLPGESMDITIEVLDSKWNPVKNANGSLSIVDESVLALKWNPRKNPYSFFYDMKRYLWVESYSNLKYLVEKLEVKDVTGGEKWWAWEWVKWWETKKLRWNFKDTAFWLSDFTTDEKWNTKISIPVMPDNLTTWVLEALVTTPEDNKVGIAYETVMTTRPVMVEDNLPRFLSAWDQITFSPVVYNRTGKDDEFKVTLEATNGTLQSIPKTVLIKNWESQKVDFVFQVKDTSEVQAFDISQIKITAQSKTDTMLLDGILKNIPIYNTSLRESVSTVWKTKDISFDENVKVPSNQIKNTTLSVNYWATLLSYLFDGLTTQADTLYSWIEQKTSALMPHIYLKQLYESAWKTYDLKTKTIKKYIDTQIWYKEISLDEAIQDYLSEVGKFQNTDGWFLYWYDSDYKISNLDLTMYVVSSLAEMQKIWYNVNQKNLDKAVWYLKNEFNKKAICTEKVVKNCISLNDKVEILLALLSLNSNDYEIFRMYKILPEENISKSLQLDIMSKMLSISSLWVNEKSHLEDKIITWVNQLISNELVFNPRGAFLSTSNYSRVQNTAKFLEIIARTWKEKFADIENITDNMLRFIASSKMNNGFWSSLDNTKIIQSLTQYLGKVENISQTNLLSKIHLNGKEIQSTKIDAQKAFEIFSTDIPQKDIQSQNTIQFEKIGTGSLYYDINMSYYIPSKNISAVDEGFFVDKTYYSFEDYKKIEALKNEEYQKYLDWKITLYQLKYPREVVDYLLPIQKGKIWDLVLVYNKVVTNEARDQVAFESFIPAGSEIINTNIATENQTINDVATNISLDRKELRDERYFAWKNELLPWIYNFSYTIRLTHNWVYQMKPTQVSEYYKPEVFGRSKWDEFRVE